MYICMYTSIGLFMYVCAFCVYGSGKKTRATYLFSQKSAKKQCATPEIKKLSAFVQDVLNFHYGIYK